MKIWKSVSDTVLIWILVISLIVIIANDFVFADVEEILPFGDALGNVLSNLSLAYMASLIFYFVVVVRKEYQDKVRIYKTVTNLCSELIGRAFSVYDMVVAGSATERTLHSRQTVTKQQFIDMCKHCNQNNLHPNRGIQMDGGARSATYGQLIYHNSVHNAKALISQIFTYMPFLDSQLVEKINRMKSSVFFIMSPSLNQIVKNTDCLPYAESMYDFILLIRDLENFNEKLKVKYSLN